MPESSPLTIYAGSTARQRLKASGWDPNLFSLMIGASGGPKWFVLKQLDEFVFGEWLASGTQTMDVIGSSIGSWRNACLVQDDPVKAIGALAKGYAEQSYSTRRPSPMEITAVSTQMLMDICAAENGVDVLIEHPRYRTHVVTARGGNFTGSSHTPVLAPSLGLAAIANAIHRKALSPFFQRVVFSSKPGHSEHIAFDDFGTAHIPLNKRNAISALMASGSIPFVLAGERNIKGAPLGHYWDGGIIDYHFNLDFYTGDGLILYPHFSSEVTTGWFDKFLPWRKGRSKLSDKLVLIAPSDEFISSLPNNKLPDRNDFMNFEPEERVKIWYEAMDASAAVADAFKAQLEKSDPLENVRFLPTEFA